jgi:hypothetical protein
VLQDIKAELLSVQAERDQLKRLYDQLVGEDSTESVDHRRIHVLKAQNMQVRWRRSLFV